MKEKPLINANKRELIYKDEVYSIVGAALDVSNELGCGFLEAVYHEALEIEFENRKIPFESQKRINITYKNILLKKEYIADFFCYGQIVVEVKAIKKITVIEEAQLLNYLNAAKLPAGLIINFGVAKLEWKRYANTR